MTRPNLLLITADQWRGDCLSGAGHPVVRTPYLDELAARGARFDRAYSATPSCIPARAALHTGLSQRNHGRVGYRDGVPWTYPGTLASTLGRAGYQTRAIGKMHVHPERNRIGFDEVVLHDGYLHFARDRRRDPRLHDDYRAWLARRTGNPAADEASLGLQCNSVVARPWPWAEELHPTNWVVSEAIDFLYRRDTTTPFFLNLSFHRPHPPYDPPAWAFEQYLAAPGTTPPMGDWTSAFEPWRDDTRADANIARYDELTTHRARAGYFGHMSHIDTQLNYFLQTLAEFGELDNTWICFTSDHGEMLGDHGMWRKAYPYEGSARVPLILAGPGLPGHVVSEAVVELRDIMPTLLDAAGIQDVPTMDGHSLLPLAATPSGNAAPPVRDHLHGEHVLFGQSMHWITDHRYKYVWLSAEGIEQLFDLHADPEEARDLSADHDHQPELARQRARLVNSLAGRPEAFVHDGLLVPGRPVRTELTVTGSE
ncbi:arylsulfatase [Actinorhabdospora filicis]|uniref:Arylsulfatase n=1 Tax=Actinorhabdospora filicis TaxID=1785913 RepID=A0A9W6SIM1_9ACTN|nr:arylsulfatase [Actinorhabdospora filicis]GLZ76693.1 arylsulfatase [Actinorhabdospora filicis]